MRAMTDRVGACLAVWAWCGRVAATGLRKAVAQQIAAIAMHAMVLAGAGMLANCASAPAPQQIKLLPGARWQDVAKAAGASTGTFSYRMNGRKYDLVNFAHAASPVVFEDSRLFVVLPPKATAEWDRRIGQCMQRENMPFEAGVEPLHAWVLAQRRQQQAPGPPQQPAGSSTAGDVAEGAAAAVILAPIAPFLLAGTAVGASEYAMTGKDRQRAQCVNDALVGSGPSYAAFFAQLPKPELQVARGSYQVNEYLATKGSFFTWNDYFYHVGLRHGKVAWVAYQSTAIRGKTYQYWRAHRST